MRKLWFCLSSLLLLLLLSLVAYALLRPKTISNPPTPIIIELPPANVTVIRRFFLERNEPLADNAWDFYYARTPYLLVAIAQVESTGGLHVPNSTNPFGWGCSTPSECYSFNSLSQGIEIVGERIQRKVDVQRLSDKSSRFTEIKKIEAWYCPSSYKGKGDCENKVHQTMSILEEMERKEELTRYLNRR